LRFLVKQLDLLRFMAPGEVKAYLPLLRIPLEPAPEQWFQVAEAEMQRRALEVLCATRRLYEGVVGQDIVQRIVAAGRGA